MKSVRGLFERSRRAAIPLGGVALAGCIVFFGSRAPVPEDPFKNPRPKVRRSSEESNSANASESTWVAPVPPVPLEAASEAQTARAMDDAGLRYQIARLRMAAMAGDPNVTASVQLAVRRYGRDASALLTSEIEREADPVVREALIGARKGLR